MDYRIELANRSFTKLEYLEDEAENISWEYARVSGCGSFSFTLPRSVAENKFLSGDFNIKIYHRNPATDAFDLWYQGLIERVEPVLRGGLEVIKVDGHGYFAQLGRIRFTKTYSSTELSAVVKDILDTYVTGETDLSYDGADIQNTGFTPSTLEFKNATAEEAIQTCADTAGGIEWGVDRNRKVFFKARSINVSYHWVTGGDIMSEFKYMDDFSSVVNKIYIQGGQVSGSPFTYNDTLVKSKKKYGLREDVIQNDAIVTADVAQQFIDAYFDEFGDVVRRGTANLEGYENLLESSTPLGVFREKLPDQPTYSTAYYGLEKYSGPIDFQINRIAYSINRDGSLTTGLTLGEIRPDEAEYLSRLEYKLEALRKTDL